MTDDNNIKPKFDIGDIVIDSDENKIWRIIFIYTPWMDNPLYVSAYNSFKLRCPGEKFFYALRLLNGKDECMALESTLRKISE